MGCHALLQGIVPDPGIEPMSPALAGGFFVCVLSHFSCVRLFETLWTIAHQAPLSMDSPGRNTGVSGHALLQGIFLTQGSNLCLLGFWHYRRISLLLIYQGKPGAVLYHLEYAFTLFYMKYLMVTIFYKAQHS